ncbi:zinc finger protein 652-like isoform X31 [Euwallacea similis]|uniref:zinc finger protein 652-like isoform X31 n=1 Tax=Euwallacea similis TaxID=1736056 RepID=UPI00344E6A3C
MDNPGEILRLCRLCLVKDQVNIPIFEEQGDIRQTFLKIRSCLPVKVSRDDKLPKKICGGCSNKLDLFYEFWSSTANSEKTLQSWLGQEEEDDKMQEITKPVEALVKEESEALEDGHAHDQSFDEATKDEAEAPPAKRARRTAAVKAQINISHDSDEDEDVDGAEPITKIEDESDDSDGEEKDPSYTEVPGTSADDQAGPSGLGKDGVEAPKHLKIEKKYPYRRPTVCRVILKIPRILVETGLVRLQKDPPLKKPLISKNPEDVWNETIDRPIQPVGVRPKAALNDPELWPVNERHMGSDGMFKCPSCGRLFNKRTNLREHIKNIHQQRYACTCPECGKYFVTGKSLVCHRASIHKKFKCLCGEECPDMVGLKDHAKICPRNFRNRFRVVTCSACQKRIADIEIDSHITQDHPGENAIGIRVCPREGCGANFDSYVGLINHLRMHRKKYPTNNSKSSHVRRKYQCCVCGKTYTSAPFLEDHVRMHAGSRPFMCEKCGRTFTSNSYLKTHMSVHRKVPEYRCTVCGKDYMNRAALYLHEKEKHPEVIGRIKRGARKIVAQIEED